MTHRILHFNFIENSAVIKLNEKCIADRAFFRIMIFSAEPRLLDAMNLSPKSINAGVGSGRVRAEE
jgi:hypothetical protein